MAGMMQIGELAQAVGVNPSAIRYYESAGLLPPPSRSAGGYRLYSEQHRVRLDFILRARSLDLSLDEIREILDFRDHGEAPCAHVERLIGDKIEEIEARIAQLRRLQDELRVLHEQARTLSSLAPADQECICQIIERK